MLSLPILTYEEIVHHKYFDFYAILNRVHILRVSYYDCLMRGVVEINALIETPSQRLSMRTKQKTRIRSVAGWCSSTDFGKCAVRHSALCVPSATVVVFVERLAETVEFVWEIVVVRAVHAALVVEMSL